MVLENRIKEKDQRTETGDVQYIVRNAQDITVETVNHDAIGAMMDAYYRDGYTYAVGEKTRGKCRCGCS